MTEIRGLDAWVRALADQELPTLNSVVKDICALSEKDAVRADDLTKIILRDADLTSKVLKISNSVHYNRAFSPIRTVSRAIVQLGFNNLKNITLTTTLIEGFLKGKPKEQLVQLLAKSFHAAVQAKALVPQLNAEYKEQVFIAALLRNIGELALAATGKEIVEKFISERDRHPENERQLALDLLGVDIESINKKLIDEWTLGELVRDAANEENMRPNNMTRAINLGNEISKCISKGMSSPEMQRIYANIAQLCDISPEAAKRQVSQMAEEASVIAKSYGADVLLRAMPDAHIEEAVQQVAAPTGYEFQQHLNHIHRMAMEGGDISNIMQSCVTALQEGAGIARVTIAMVDYKSKSLDARYVAGKGTGLWRQNVHIELDKLQKGELLYEFLRVQQAVWYQPQKAIKPIGALGHLSTSGDMMMAPLKIQKRLIAILYADNKGYALSAGHYENFQLVANQLNLILQVSASQASASK